MILEAGSKGAREQGSKGAREQGSKGAREQGSKGARERGSHGTKGARERECSMCRHASDAALFTAWYRGRPPYPLLYFVRKILGRLRLRDGPSSKIPGLFNFD